MRTNIDRFLVRVRLFTLAVIATFTSGCLIAAAPLPPPTYVGGVHVATETVEVEPAVTTTVVDVEDNDPSALTEFRGELEAYGTWMDDARYGVIWVPDPSVAGADFAPYVSGGQWTLTSDGDWLWESTYPFGWVTFHYGRWLWTREYGWIWFPGRRYAHAWVSWRTGYDSYTYVGWAPLPPAYYWRGGVAIRFWYEPPLPFVFCHSHHVFGRGMHEHLIRGEGAREAHAKTHPHQPAAASRAGGEHQPGSPSRGSGNDHRFSQPSKGPSLREAHVPPDRAPQTRTAPDPRAWSRASVKRPAPTSRVSPASPQTLPRSHAPSSSSSPSRVKTQSPTRVAPPRPTPASRPSNSVSSSRPSVASSRPSVSSSRPSSSVSSSRPSFSSSRPSSSVSSSRPSVSSSRPSQSVFSSSSSRTSRPSSGGSRPSGIRTGGGRGGKRR